MKRAKYNISTKLDWYEVITELIDQDLEDFTSTFYPESDLKKTGKGFSLEPCPVCGHHDCSFISFGNLVNCFSCNWGGTYINAWRDYAMNVKGMSYGQAMKKLEDFYGVPLPSETPEETEAYKKHMRRQEILRFAEDYYYEKLINEGETILYDGVTISPYKYLVNIRRRTEKTIKEFKIGYSKDFIELKVNLIAAGFTEDEIKLAKVQVPDGLLVYFYHHPTTKEIVRINTKNPFKVKAKFYDGNGNFVESDDVLAGWSSGDKIIYTTPKFTFKKPVILVEGENDIQAVYEQGFENVVATGGNPSPEMLDILSKCQGTLYTFFDNDDVGTKYKNMINEKFPDKIVKNINYDIACNDPDEYFTSWPNPLPLQTLLDEATPLVTDKYKISHEGNVWRIKDREHTVEFIIKNRDNKGQLIGQANLLDADNKPIGRNIDTSLVKCKGKFTPFSFYLSDEIDKYLNTGLDTISFKELADRYQYSSRRDHIIGLLAKKLFDAEDKVDDMVSELKRVFKGIPSADKVIDQVLIEYNNLSNKNIVKQGGIIPRIKISQYYNLLNNEAYFYYTCKKDDGDAVRAIPYLLKNDGTQIRLDLLRRKDNQCLLLIDNKYELPFEVPTAVFDTMSCSLQDVLVDDFRDGKIPPEQIRPSALVRELEAWIRKFYYTRDENIYKVLSLWIFGTYFYVMFGQYPYLYVNGEKGSGKTILNNVLTMLAFNGRTIVDTSESALFRMSAIEGGTLMLDEQETMTSRSATAQSPVGSIMKAGYASCAYVARTNLEKGCVETFDTYCPKVISNIFGLEDVTNDRCIPINTYRLSVSKDLKIEDPKYYIENDQEGYRSLTSRLCFCALKHFQVLNDIYRDKMNLFESDTARVSQLLTPVLSIAKWVDMEEVAEKRASIGISNVIGEYEKALLDYFKETIQSYKSDIEENTPEGIIKKVVKTIAMELVGKAEKEYTISEGRKYSDPITRNLDEGWFEMNVLHFKCFLEENMPGEKVYSRIIPKWLKTCFNFDKSEIKRRTVHIENDDLIRELQGQRTTKVNTYRFYVKDFVKSDFLDDKVDSVDNDTSSKIDPEDIDVF